MLKRIAVRSSPQTVNIMKIYVDEYTCNIHVKRSFARSIRGKRAYQPVATQLGRNVTVCAAITALHGIVYFELYRKGIKNCFFGDFCKHSSTHFLIAEHGASLQAYLIFDRLQATKFLFSLFN